MLDIERTAGVVVLKLHHGKVNALDLELLQAITAAVRDADPSDALVLTGEGRAFSAGVDLRRIVDGGPAYVAEFLPALSAAFMAIFDHPGATVAAVNGHAIAGGCVIAAACDLRLMSQGKIGLSELAVGVPFPTSAIEIMGFAVGPFARRLALGTALLDPDEARSIGLIDQLSDPDPLLDTAVGQATRMAAIPADVFAFTKSQLHRVTRQRIAECQEDQDAAAAALWASDHVQSAIGDFLTALA